MNPKSIIEATARGVAEPAPPGKKTASFQLPGLRRWMIVLIMLGSVLNYLTRNTLSLAQV